MAEKCRAIRVLEYTFPSFEAMERHMSSMGVPSTGVRHFGSENNYITIRSALVTAPVLFPEEFPDDSSKD